MKRGHLLRPLAVVLFTVLSAFLAWSQPPSNPRRVGVLLNASPGDPASKRNLQALVDGLRDYGWEEGRNVVLEARFPQSGPTHFSDLAAELVSLNVDVILSSVTPAIAAARSKTATIPIIMVGPADPVGTGFVASLARPGGNITGIANQIETISVKNLELVKEIKPGIRRIGILFSPDNSSSGRIARAMQEEVPSRLGVTVVPIGVTKPEDIAEAFANIVREQLEGLLVLPTGVLALHRTKIADFAVQHKLPTMAPFDLFARDGLLMSYGYDSRITWRRAASFVDRILKGAMPTDLPVEQMDRFQLIINLKTARAIGLDMTLLLSRADEVIE